MKTQFICCRAHNIKLFRFLFCSNLQNKSLYFSYNLHFFIFYFLYSGFEALTEIQNLLKSNGHASSIKESLIVDASNRFFTVIPSIHPHIIRDEDDFKSKVHKLPVFTFTFSHILKPVAFMPFLNSKSVSYAVFY